jgi:hypothetical protein
VRDSNGLWVLGVASWNAQLELVELRLLLVEQGWILVIRDSIIWLSIGFSWSNGVVGFFVGGDLPRNHRFKIL